MPTGPRTVHAGGEIKLGNRPTVHRHGPWRSSPGSYHLKSLAFQAWKEAVSRKQPLRDYGLFSPKARGAPALIATMASLDHAIAGPKHSDVLSRLSLIRYITYLQPVPFPLSVRAHDGLTEDA